MSEAYPYGGNLVSRKLEEGGDVSFDARINIDRDVLLNIEQIATGVFSPLEGFMSKDEFLSCTDKMRLPNGLIWPLPIVLSITEKDKEEIKKIQAKKLGLFYENALQAVLDIEDIYNLKTNYELDFWK